MIFNLHEHRVDSVCLQFEDPDEAYKAYRTLKECYPNLLVGICTWNTYEDSLILPEKLV